MSIALVTEQLRLTCAMGRPSTLTFVAAHSSLLTADTLQVVCLRTSSFKRAMANLELSVLRPAGLYSLLSRHVLSQYTF